MDIAKHPFMNILHFSLFSFSKIHDFMKPFYLFVILASLLADETTTHRYFRHQLDSVQHSSAHDPDIITLDFSTAVDLMFMNNNAIKAAEKNVDLAKRQSQLVNASWYPTITMTGTYIIMSEKIGVSQEYASLLDPLKEKYSNTFLVPDVLNYISSSLGNLKFDVPILENNFGSVDLELVYPIFTGVKRIYANKLAKNNETLSEINKESIGATKYLELINVYFSLNLTESMVKVLKETHEMTKNHYHQALKMENTGLFDKAERLIVKVSLDESDRNLKSAENQAEVLINALNKIIGQEDSHNQTETHCYKTTTPLFLNEKYPQLEWFREMMYKNSYVFRQSDLHDEIAKTSLSMSKSNYYPVISLFGKQTIASYQVPENLVPNTIAGINLAWDIFDGLARERNIQMSKIESEIVSEAQQNLKNELKVAIDEWYANLKQACINAIDLNSSLELAEEVYKIRKKAFTEGLATSQQVLDALNLLNKTKLLLLTTYYEYDIALANLCCLCGIPDYFESFLNNDP